MSGLFWRCDVSVGHGDETVQVDCWQRREEQEIRCRQNGLVSKDEEARKRNKNKGVARERGVESGKNRNAGEGPASNKLAGRSVLFFWAASGLPAARPLQTPRRAPVASCQLPASDAPRFRHASFHGAALRPPLTHACTGSLTIQLPWHTLHHTQSFGNSARASAGVVLDSQDPSGRGGGPRRRMGFRMENAPHPDQS